MDTLRPHGLVPGHEIPEDDRRARERFMPITNEEFLELAAMTREQRHAWLVAKLPTKERLARHLGAEGLHDLAYNARAGRYDDFDAGGATLPQLELLRDLKRKGRYDLTWIVTSGEYDAKSSEGDAWARNATGELGQVLDELGLR